jgi:WD40 repeat protein
MAAQMQDWPRGSNEGLDCVQRDKRQEIGSFLMRPDGSARKNIINTSDFHEAAARFAPDGQKILYYRIPRAAKVDNNTYGTFDLVIANVDGSNPVIFGKDYPWASWGPRGETLSCLSKNGIQIIDVSTKTIVRALDRKGIFEQLFSSPDGKWLCGTANGLGEHWTIARMDSTSGELNPVSDGSCYNCTPDWFPDSTRIIFSSSCTLVTHSCGWRMATELEPHLRRAAATYTAAWFPRTFGMSFLRIAKIWEGRQLLTTIALMRFQDARYPGESPELQLCPGTKEGPVWDLSFGWEPHWTYADLKRRRQDHMQPLPQQTKRSATH